jgi:hypothetical protein
MRLSRKTKPTTGSEEQEPAARARSGLDGARAQEAERRDVAEGMSARVLIAMARAARRPAADA